jgi:hypothetical protein
MSVASLLVGRGKKCRQLARRAAEESFPKQSSPHTPLV